MPPPLLTLPFNKKEQTWKVTEIYQTLLMDFVVYAHPLLNFFATSLQAIVRVSAME